LQNQNPGSDHWFPCFGPITEVIGLGPLLRSRMRLFVCACIKHRIVVVTTISMIFVMEIDTLNQSLQTDIVVFQFYFNITYFSPPSKNQWNRYDTGLKNPNRRIDALDKILSKQEFLVDGGFSVADVAVASYLLYVPQFFQGINLSRWPNVVRYMKDCASRPHYGEAFGSGVQQYLIESLDAMGGGEKKKLFGMF